MIVIGGVTLGNLEPLEAELVDEPSDHQHHHNIRMSTEQLAARWLAGFTTAKTRNQYALAIGLSAATKKQLPDAPADPSEPDEFSWIEWATNNGVHPYGELTDDIVVSWLQAIERGYTPRTHRGKQSPDEARMRFKQQRFAVLASFYKYLRGKKIVLSDPNDLVDRRTMHLYGKPPSTTRPLTPGQVHAMYVAARLDGSEHQERNLAIVAVLAATGCRVSELVALNDAHYTRNHPEENAELRLYGKGGRVRDVVLPAPDADLVEAYLQVRPEPRPTSTAVARHGDVAGGAAAAQQPLFRNRDGNRLHVDTVSPMLKRVANLPQADDPRDIVRGAERDLRGVRDTIRPHQFRHAYAVTADKNGATAPVIQANLGHGSLGTTQGYLDNAAKRSTSAAPMVSATYHSDDELSL